MILKTIYDIYNNLKKIYGDNDFIVFKEDGVWVKLKVEDSIERINRLIAALNYFGFEQGDKIALKSTTRYEWTLFDMAIEVLGMVNVPIYHTLTLDQTKHIINHSDAKAVIVSDNDTLNELLKIDDELGNINKYILIEGNDNGLDNVLTMEKLEEIGKALIEKSGINFIHDIGKSITENDLASIIYTSGTTGVPKGVMLSHKNFISNIYGSMERANLEICERTLLYLPLSHSYGRTTAYALMASGISLWYAESFNTLADDMQQAKPNIITVVPRVLEKIYSNILQKATEKGFIGKAILEFAEKTAYKTMWKEQNNEKLSLFEKFKYKIANILFYKKIRNKMGGAIRTIICGSSALSTKLSYFFNGMKLPIIEGYGLTEASPMVCGNSLAHNKLGSVGYPYFNVKVKLSDANELLVKGDNVMMGYYKNEDETNSTITKDGWLKTGDICTMDDDNNIYIIDREKDLIKTSNGKLVAPQKIENIARQSTFISELFVIGEKEKFISAMVLPDFKQIMKKAKEIDISFDSIAELLKNNNIILFFENIVGRINNQLSNFEQIKKFTLLSSPFTIEGGELTPTLKVIRKAIAKKYEKEISMMYE